MVNNTFRAIAGVLALVLPLLASAALEARLESKMEAFLVSEQDSREVFKPADAAEPGDTLEYRLSYSNTTEKALSALQVAVPVSENTLYLEKSAKTAVPSRFEVSIDNGKTWQMPPVKREYKDKEGNRVSQVVPVSEYTHLRWVVNNPIQAGEQQTFSYRIRIL